MLLTDLNAFYAHRPQKQPTHPRRWRYGPGLALGIVAELCAAVGARGNTVPDAFLAALAIEHGATWASADRDFARFPGLRWRTTLEP